MVKVTRMQWAFIIVACDITPAKFEKCITYVNVKK